MKKIDPAEAQALLARLMSEPVDDQIAWVQANRTHPIARSLRSFLSATGVEGVKAEGASISRNIAEEGAEHVTPPEFMAAVAQRFWLPQIDLAASEKSQQAPLYISRDANSLSVDWKAGPQRAWLNPPYGKDRWSSGIYPWVNKSYLETRDGLQVLVLVPVATGKWFRECVWRRADIYLLSERMKFVGETHGYIKDLMLLHYHRGSGSIVRLWRWMADEMIPMISSADGGACNLACLGCEKSLLNRDGLMEPPHVSRGFCKVCRKRAKDKQTSLLET